MTPWLAPILALLNKLIDGLKSWQRRKRQKREQDESDAIETDPVAFGRNHFNSVRPVPDDADETPDTNPAELDRQRSRRRDTQ